MTQTICPTGTTGNAPASSLPAESRLLGCDNGRRHFIQPCTGLAATEQSSRNETDNKLADGIHQPVQSGTFAGRGGLQPATNVEKQCSRSVTFADWTLKTRYEPAVEVRQVPTPFSLSTVHSEHPDQCAETLSGAVTERSELFRSAGRSSIGQPQPVPIWKTTADCSISCSAVSSAGHPSPTSLAASARSQFPSVRTEKNSRTCWHSSPRGRMPTISRQPARRSKQVGNVIPANGSPIRKEPAVNFNFRSVRPVNTPSPSLVSELQNTTDRIFNYQALTKDVFYDSLQRQALTICLKFRTYANQCIYKTV